MSYASVDQLAEALRIRVTAANTTNLQQKLDAAAAVCDQYMDRADDPLVEPFPAAVVDANILFAVDGWKAADATLGLGFEQVGVATSAMPATWARAELLLTPYKKNWAVA